MKLVSVVAALFFSLQSYAGDSVVTNLPEDFVISSSISKRWEILNDYSVFLFNQNGSNKIWLQFIGGPVIFFWNASNANYHSYKTSDDNSDNVVITFGNAGPTIICNFLSCQKDNLYLKFEFENSYLHYFDKENDLRALWNDKSGACSYSYYFSGLSCLYKKFDWIDKLSSSQSFFSAQDTLVLRTGSVINETKNQIIDLNTGTVTNEIISSKFTPVKLSGSGRLWYAYASNISYTKWGVVRAGLTENNLEFDLAGFESQINQIMKAQNAEWLSNGVLVISALESSQNEASVVARFHQKGASIQYLAILDLSSKKATVIRDEKGVLVKVSDVFRINRQTNRLYAQTAKNKISVWNLNSNEFMASLTSSLVNIDDIRVRGNRLYMIDLNAGKLESITTHF